MYPNILLGLISKASHLQDRFAAVYVDAIIKLLQTYDSIVLGCVRMGIASLIYKYVLCEDSELKNSGL